MTTISNDWEAAIVQLRQSPEHKDLMFAAYYDDPLLGAAMRYWQGEEWTDIRRLLPRNRLRALDVGAGRGIASFALAKEGFEVNALEPNGSSLVGAGAIRNLATQTGLPITVTQEFSERLPFPNASFDLVFARAVLHHTTDLAAACREFYRVLKPGGRFIAVREHVISKTEDISAFFEIHPLHRLYGGENAFLLKQYTQAIQVAGFVLEKIIAPFDSAINYAPHTQKTLSAEIAARAGRHVPVAQWLLRQLLGIPPVWVIARRMLTYLDHRPGRLYSFIAKRP